MSIDDDRLAGLARVKLEGLVRRAFPEVTEPATSFPAGAVITAGDGRLFVYPVRTTPSPLATLLALGATAGATELHLLLDDPVPVLATQAEGVQPRPHLWRITGTDLEAWAQEADPARPPAPSAPARALIPLLEAGGCDIVIEHGVIVGEILGLEVARVVVGAEGEASLRVGVGLYDQEAHELMHAKVATAERLDLVVAEVRRHRAAGAAPHPINRVARERWLRAIVLAEPALLGLESAEPLPPLEPRGGIYDGGPAALLGAVDGEQVLAVTSAGVDLDAVPCAAGHLARSGATRVILALPERDHHAVIERQMTYLAAPASLAALATPWS